MLSYGLWSRHIHRPQQPPPPLLWEFPVLVSDVAGQKNAPQQTFSHTVCQTHIYIHLNYKWGVGSGKRDSLWTDMWECAGAVDLPVVRSRWQRRLLHSGSLSIPAQGSTHCLLMFRAHLPSNTEGGRHEDRDALEKAISCSNRNMMGYSIYPIKISFTEIVKQIYSS